MTRSQELARIVELKAQGLKLDYMNRAKRDHMMKRFAGLNDSIQDLIRHLKTEAEAGDDRTPV